nr:glycosyltransferase family 29 protein [uncultured Flavobacterium sp.]
MNLISKVVRKLCFWVCLMKVKFSSKDILTNFDEKWFEDKRVAIVGGADSVLKEKLGEYIDGFDVVVRINKGVEIIATQSEYVGKKTDVLFHCFYENDSHLGGSPITPELWKESNVKNLLFALNYKHNYYTITNFLTFIKNTKKEYKFSQLPKNLYFNSVGVVQPSGPTTGFTAINTVFNCKPKELYITGITFFKTPHNTEYRNMNNEVLKKTLDINKNHTAEVEYLYIKNLYLRYPSIIKPDNTLKQIFKNN